VIGDSEGDDLEAFFTRTFARIADESTTSGGVRAALLAELRKFG